MSTFDDSLETLPLPDIVEVFEPSFAEARVAHALAPWIAPERPVLTRTHEPIAAGTFRRLIELDPTRLELLPQWFTTHARNHCVPITRACTLYAPAPRPHNTWAFPAQLRTVAMELTLWRHLPGLTMVMFQPIRKPHSNPLYFRAGHQALDELTTRLQGELA